MRIALSGWFWERTETGSGQYVRRLVETLSQLNPDAVLIVLLRTLSASKEAQIPGVRFVSVPGVKSWITGWLNRQDLRGALAKVWWEYVAVPRAARQLGVDLLHIPYWAPPMVEGLPTVVTVHDLIPLLLPNYRGGIGERLYTALVSAASSQATLLLTDSEASREDIVQHLRVPAERVRAVYLAAGPAYRTDPSPQDALYWRKRKLSPGYLLYLGGFDSRKNLRAVFRVFAIVRRALGDAELVVAGKLPACDTPFAPDPRRLMAEAGLDGAGVYFVGFVPEASKPSLYRGARAFIFPSRYEGFGLPPLEALACGVPVVGSNVSSLPEVVGDAGVLLAPDDVEGMAGALIQLICDDVFYTELRQRACRQAARFSWEATACKTWDAYAGARRIAVI